MNRRDASRENTVRTIARTGMSPTPLGIGLKQTPVPLAEKVNANDALLVVIDNDVAVMRRTL